MTERALWCVACEAAEVANHMHLVVIVSRVSDPGPALRRCLLKPQRSLISGKPHQQDRRNPAVLERHPFQLTDADAGCRRNLAHCARPSSRGQHTQSMVCSMKGTASMQVCRQEDLQGLDSVCEAALVSQFLVERADRRSKNATTLGSRTGKASQWNAETV